MSKRKRKKEDCNYVTVFITMENNNNYYGQPCKQVQIIFLKSKKKEQIGEGRRKKYINNI